MRLPMKIDDALGFSFNIENFMQSSQYVINNALLEDLSKRIKRLKKIEAQFQNAEIPKDNSIHHALIKFKLGLKKGNPEMYLDSLRLYRRFAYCLSMKYGDYSPVIDSLDETKQALSILDKNWKDSFLLGLFSSLLAAWENEQQDSVTYLRYFIFNKLALYKGSRRMLNAIKKNQYFFETQDGPVKLGLQLFFEKSSIDNMTYYLGLPRNWMSYGYFSKVIDVYFNKIKSDYSKYEEIISLLLEHNSINSYKRVLSRMIIELNKNNDYAIAQLVRDAAFKLIGDSSINSKWAAPSTFTKEETDTLHLAQDILNQWITSQFISVFFEVCINDLERKNFWLERSKYVNRFKIFGPQNMFVQLKQDSRIATFVQSRFKITSKRLNVAAIMMHVREYCLIEFSDDGYAFLSYKQNSPYCPSMDFDYESVADLRNSNMPVISVREGSLADYNTQEGRLFHKNFWQRPFRQYLEAHVIKY